MPESAPNRTLQSFVSKVEFPSSGRGRTKISFYRAIKYSGQKSTRSARSGR